MTVSWFYLPVKWYSGAACLSHVGEWIWHHLGHTRE